ncbi:ATPase, T2SS/T4P/T4SS family [Bilifractor porci]|uniref:ATPase, T2SS/T4P/T4SS family n=1 Tax=Bilifractor porci TaxID=2606636 RepID=UPI0012B34137|nr:ATPase, T2SS/T4P/T4SS family [Bilifractor porci]
MNTGHEGSLGTAHANSAGDMVERLVSMVMMSGMELPVPVIRRQIAAGVEILVHLSRDSTGKRKVEEIAEITGMENGEVCLRKIFSRDGRGCLVRQNGLLREEKLRRLQERRASGKNRLQKL